jgi:hypothetical protein
MFLFVLRNSRYALGKKKIKMEGWGLALAHMNFTASTSAPYKKLSKPFCHKSSTLFCKSLDSWDY